MTSCFHITDPMVRRARESITTETTASIRTRFNAEW